MGCVAYDVVYVIKSVWMREHALHFVIRRGVWGLQGASPYGFGLLGGFFFLLLFFYLSAQSRTVMMIIPLPHYGNNFATTNFGRKKCVEVPPPPPPPTPLISFFMQDLRDFRGWHLQLRGILPPPPQANTLAPPLLVCAVYDVSHLLPQPHPTTFHPTLSHNMYYHDTTNIQQHHYHYHTTPH